MDCKLISPGSSTQQPELNVVQFKSIPSYNSILQSINSQVTTNERNARTANKSLEDVLDACGPENAGLTPKAINHCKLLDKQEKERQKALEDMLEKFEQSKRDNLKVMEAISTMRKDIEEERDSCNRKEVEEMKKLYGEQTKETSKGDDGDDIVEEQESRKRKRDTETDEHADIDMPA